MDSKKIFKCVIGPEGSLGVEAISLVEFPAIESNWIALKKEVKLKALDNERRMLYGPALIPDKPILRIDKETGEEYYIVFDKETIYNCAHAFMKNGFQNAHTFKHMKPIEGVTVVESWYKESDNDKSAFLGMDVPVGTWVIGSKVDNPEIWASVKEGKVKGFSIEGYFDHVGLTMGAVSPEALALQEIEKLFNSF
jgi:hypothetical protein